MAMDPEMKCMNDLTKLDDETRERVLAWAARKWLPKVTMSNVAPPVVSADHTAGSRQGDKAEAKR